MAVNIAQSIKFFYRLFFLDCECYDMFEFGCDRHTSEPGTTEQAKKAVLNSI